MAGPELGGTIITITADGFPAAQALQCVFGASSSLAFALSPNRITCFAPPFIPGSVSLHVEFSSMVTELPAIASSFETLDLLGNPDSLLGQPPRTPSVSYEYFPTVHILAIEPNFGPVFGGTHVYVYGHYFGSANTSALHHQCRFGDVIVPAEYVNGTTLLCRSPRHTSAKVPVEVSINQQDFTTNGVLFDFATFSIMRVWPSRGPISGGTKVVLDLDGIPDALQLYCKFGNTPLVEAARTTNETKLQCVTPSHPLAIVPLMVLSMADVSAFAAEFEFAMEPKVSYATPRRLLESAMTPIYVHGENFLNTSSLTCAFGSARTNATYLSNTTIVCVSPYFSGLVGGDMTVKLRISTNEQDFSQTYSTINYVTCPDGSYCSHLQILDCPPGAYCNSQDGSNITLCPPGTYQSAVGHGTCTVCAVGFFCPSHGMYEPIICAAGMVCSIPGLSFPDSPCPPGHFCPSGVATMDPLSLTQYKRPLECPENTWCPFGVVTNVTRPGNLSTPQPCLAGFVCYRGSDSPQGSGPCPTGYYCPPNSLPIECPTAHYCPGVGNVFPSQCTPGYYNDKYGRNQCIECPIGHICDKVGLGYPVLCPAGSVCNEPGLNVPSMACPPGYFCWESTETADWNAETVYKPIACPKAVYCLGGITNNITDENDYRSPQPCPLGQFCKEASTSPFGTGRCPAGFFCPKGTADPYPAPAGYFSRGEGNSQAVPCLAGTWSKYNPHNGTDDCFLCPGGYSCDREGTIQPLPCTPGTFRKYNGTVSCQLCPEGSWNPYYANPLESLCLPCPKGRVCGVKGMTNMSQSDPCPGGHICDVNTTSSSKYATPCPEGYWCDQESNPGHLACAAGMVVEEQREALEAQMGTMDDPICPDLDTIGTIQRSDKRMCYCPIGLCPAGYICYTATPSDTRRGNPCLVGYFCPEGTSGTSLMQQKCPPGTTSPPQSESVRQCVRLDDRVTAAISSEFFTFTQDDIEIKFKNYIIQTNARPDLTCRPAPNEPSCSSPEAIASAQENAGVPYKNRRKLLGVEHTGLQELANRTVGSLSENITFSRRLQEEAVSQYGDGVDPPVLTTFYLPAFTMARFTMHLADKLPPDLIYSDHYRIGIFVFGHKYPKPYPPSFWFDPPAVGNQYYSAYTTHRWSKNSNFALNLHSMRDLYFRVELQILHGLYSKDLALFEKTMTMELLPGFDLDWGPDRAHPGVNIRGKLQRAVFIAAVEQKGAVALPFNLPRLLPSTKHYGIDHMKPYTTVCLQGPISSHAQTCFHADLLLIYSVPPPSLRCRTATAMLCLSTPCSTSVFLMVATVEFLWTRSKGATISSHPRRTIGGRSSRTHRCRTCLSSPCVLEAVAMVAFLLAPTLGKGTTRLLSR